MSKGRFTDTEEFRLKKLLTKIKSNNSDGSKKHNSFICFTLSHGCVLPFILIMCDIHLAFQNMNGARESKKRGELSELLKQKRIDVLFPQEAHSDACNARDWAKERSGLSVLSHNTLISRGVAIIFSRSLTRFSFNVEEVIASRLLKGLILTRKCLFLFARMPLLQRMTDCIEGCVEKRS